MTRDSYTIPSVFFDEFRRAFRERFPGLDATISTYPGGSAVSPPFVDVESVQTLAPDHTERFRLRNEFLPGQCERINRLYREGKPLGPLAESFLDYLAANVRDAWPTAWPEPVRPAAELPVNPVH